MPNPYPQPTAAQLAQMQSDIDNNVAPTDQEAQWWAYVLYGTPLQTTPTALLVWEWPSQVRLARMQILLDAMKVQN